MDEKEEEIITEEVFTEQPPTPPPKEPTKLDLFIQELSQYPDKETAKTHITDIAKKLRCAKSLGYKAIKKVEQFKPQQAEAVEATLKIKETTSEPLEEQEEPEAEATIEEPTAPPEPAVGFRAKDVTWMFDRGFGGLAKLTGYGDFALEKEDSQKLGEIWTPILNEYLPDWLPYAPIAIAAITTTAIVAPKVKGYMDYRAKKKEEKLPEKPPEKTKQEPTPEPPKEPQKQEPAVPDKPTKAGFMEHLA
jgi:hypothetical protein